MSMEKHRMTNRVIISDNTSIFDHIQTFYTSTATNPKASNTAGVEPNIIVNVGSEDIFDITQQEICTALKQLKNMKSSEMDRITCQILILGGSIVNKCLKGSCSTFQEKLQHRHRELLSNQSFIIHNVDFSVFIF